MKRLTTIFTLLLIGSFALSSCYSSEVPETSKVTYIVTGTAFDVIYQDPAGKYQYVYDREGSFKVYQETLVGDPVFLLAKGSDDVVVHIRIKDGIDTVRKAKTAGTSLVFIDYVPEVKE